MASIPSLVSLPVTQQTAPMLTYTASAIKAAPCKGIEPLHPMKIAWILNDPHVNAALVEQHVNEDEDTEMRDKDLDSEDASEDTSSATTSTSDSSTKPIRRKQRAPRPPCKKYSTEQEYFVWYYRTDLGQDWDEVERKYEHQFGDKRGKAGLQCKFYRVLDDHGVKKVREQTRSGER